METRQVKIKTLSGKPQREEFTAFELEALKAVALRGSVGVQFVFGNDGETFAVNELKNGYISITREKTGKELRAKCIVLDAQAETAETAPAAVEQTQPTAKPAASTSANSAEIVENLRALLASPHAAAVDAEQVRAIVAEEVAKLKPTQTNIYIKNAPAVNVAGCVHPATKEVLFLLSNGMPVYMHGGAGSGKTTAAKQAAEALGLPFYAASALQDKSELTGYCDINGNYIQTDFYKAFSEGGVFLLDEIDSTSAEVLVPFNMAIANRIYNFPGVGMVKAHDNFHVLAAANTSGQGRTNKYNGRFKIDASTLDRFAFVYIDYCEEVEVAMAGGDSELVAFVRAVRASIDKLGLTYTATPRACERIYKLTAGGYSVKDALKIGLCGGWEKQDIHTICVNIGGDNARSFEKYAFPFQDIAAEK